MTSKNLNKLFVDVRCKDWDNVDTEEKIELKAVDYPYLKWNMNMGTSGATSVSDTLAEIIDKHISKKLQDELVNAANNNKSETKKEEKKENNMNNNIKNVLFLAPGYNYAKSVVTNQSKELDRKKIPYTASTVSNNFYIHTDKVHIEIVYMDPIKWTPDLFQKRDAVFGKKELVDKAKDTFIHCFIRRPNTSLSKYIREAHTEKVDPMVADVKPRETYIPEIKNAYFNNPMTVVIWEDGTKTMVRCQEGDVYSAETGLALCIAKKALGNMPNFNNIFRKWVPDDLKPNNIVMKVDGVNFMNALKDGSFYDRFKDGIQRAFGHDEV